MMMMSQVASAVHCTCCHVCHVSMKQRPRQLLACHNCNTIICRTCLETRWKTDQWATGALEAEWVCHKCRGDCPCKSCRGKGGSNTGGMGVARKRSLMLPDDMDSSTPAYEGSDNNNNNNNNTYYDSAAADESSSLLALVADVASSPQPRVKRHAALLAAPPGRQPSLPPGFQVTTHTSRPAAPVFVAPDKMGLGGIFHDHGAPVHLKVLELSRQRDACDANIASMRSLLAMLEHERAVIDKSLNNLVKQTAQEVGGELRRSNSQAQLMRSLSNCNLEDLAAMSQANNTPNAAQNPAHGNVF